MADAIKSVSDSLKIESHFEKSTRVRDCSRQLKNIKRRYRRKRSKIRYYKSLKKLRCNRKTEDLCSSVSVFDITDMDWAPTTSTHSSKTLPTDVVEWQKQEQVAYWKSRAISLEFENRMLHQHLRNVYAKQIEDYANCVDSKEITAKDDSSVENTKTEKQIKEKEKKTVLPNIPEVKKRSEEMKKIYGNKAAKIMGMETAIQLNYDRHMDHSKPTYWPNLPINL